MRKKFLSRCFSVSTNPKSKIENLKWVVIVAIALTFAFGGAVASAQQTGKIFRMGILDPSTASGSAVVWEPLRQELSKLGWIEGKNIAIEHQVSNGEPQRASDIAPRAVQ